MSSADSSAVTLKKFEYSSLQDMFEKCIERYSDLVAFECNGAELTYREVGDQARSLAAFFQHVLDLQKGDSIALMTANGPAFPVTVIAAQMCGLIVVNVNPLYTPRELEHQLNDAKVKTLVVLGPVSGTFGEVAHETCVETVLVIGPQDLMVEKPEAPEVPSSIKKPIWFMTALSDGAELSVRPISVDLDDLAFLQYTGGTTGPSKGAMLSNGNILSNMAQFYQAFQTHLDEKEEIVVTALPLYHIFALTVNMFTFFQLGSKNVLIPNPRDIEAFVGAMKGKQFTAMTGVNTLFAGLPHVPAFRELDFSKFDFCIGGGAAIIGSVAQGWKDVTGTTICQAYGLSETSPYLTANDITAPKFRNSIGRAAPGTEIKLLDDDGNEVDLGESGELCAKGPQVMQGYWGREQATADTMTEDGFFKTGDIAVASEDGFFQIVDRKKDMVLVSGFNVFPNEIESVMTDFDAVLEVACIGVPDEKTGEAVKAFVVLNSGYDANLDELKEFCKDELAAYKVPKHIVIVEELPKSTVGKILRRELRAQELS